MKRPDVDPPESLVLSDELHLPVAMLSQYLFFLSRRPISSSNVHYLESRLEGMKALAPELERSGDSRLVAISEQLKRLHPANFRRLGPALQVGVLPLATANRSLPKDVVVEDSSLAEWPREPRRVLLVLGPGIGIGDELMLFPLPRALRQRFPAAEVSVLSAYSGIWERVDDVARVERYRTYAALLAALRGEPPYDGFDLVVLGDFEHPALYPAIATEARLARYLEISIGSRSGFMVDNERRWITRVHHVTPYFENYYAGLEQTLRNFALPIAATERFDGSLFALAPKRVEDRLEIFVSPFTSKYEPSEAYWSHLVTSSVASATSGGARIVIDTGSNSRTARFAAGLQRSIAARMPSSVEVRLADEENRRPVSLGSVFALLGSARVVLCADSYAAHAAPLHGCVTVVIAREGLEPWRVPHRRSFYLPAETDVRRVAAAIAELLEDLLGPASRERRIARMSGAEIELAEVTARLETELARDTCQGHEKLATIHGEFKRLLDAVAEARSRWSERQRTLFEDAILAQPARDLRPSELATPNPALQRHLVDHLQRWQNTNLYKYLSFEHGEAPSPRRAPVEVAATTGVRERPRQPATARARLGNVLERALGAVRREQLPTGEIATHFRLVAEGLEYLQSPLASTFVHDALSPFDLSSCWVEPGLFDLLPEEARGAVARQAAQVRQRIRSFLSWMETNEGTWRFHGRTVGARADLDCTSCAATVLLDTPRRAAAPAHERRIAAVVRLLDERPECELAVAANALRFLVLAGCDARPVAGLVERIVQQVADGSAPSPDRYPLSLATAYCLARAWRQGRLDMEDLRPHLLPWILDQLSEPIDGALPQALALSVLSALGHEGDETWLLFDRLMQSRLPRGGWIYGPLFDRGGGAAACTTALAMSALALGVGARRPEAA